MFQVIDRFFLNIAVARALRRKRHEIPTIFGLEAFPLLVNAVLVLIMSSLEMCEALFKVLQENFVLVLGYPVGRRGVTSLDTMIGLHTKVGSPKENDVPWLVLNFL